MAQSHLLIDIGRAILAAAVLGFPASRAGIPLILAYLAAGVLLGPELGFGIVRSAESISTLSEIGLVLLMFILGLEIDLRKLLHAGRAVLLNGVVQVLGCFGLAYVFFSMLGLHSGTGPYGLLYLSVACSLSSTLLVIKILSERFKLDTLTSRLTIGVLVIQDLWAIGFLAVQPNLAHLSAFTLLASLAKAACLVAVIWAAAKWILPRIFHHASRHPELMLLIAMGWCFASCGLAEALNLSLEMGALVAGVAIASFPYHVDIAAKVTSLRDFFVTLFFVSLGLQIPKPTHEIFVLCAAIVPFVMLSRVLTMFPVLYRLRYGIRASLIPGINLGQLSEFSLVLASLGVAAGHLQPALLSAFVISLAVSALISSAAIPFSHPISMWLAARLERLGLHDRISEGEEPDPQDEGPTVVLLGFFREASSLLHELLHRHSESTKERLLVVDFNPEAHRKLQALGVPCKYGDISSQETLRRLDLHNAKLLVSTLPDAMLKGTSNLKILRLARVVAPQAKVILTAETLPSALEMYRAGADYVFIPRLTSAYYLADVLERFQSGQADGIRESARTYLEGRHEVLP